MVMLYVIFMFVRLKIVFAFEYRFGSFLILVKLCALCGVKFNLFTLNILSLYKYFLSKGKKYKTFFFFFVKNCFMPFVKSFQDFCLSWIWLYVLNGLLCRTPLKREWGRRESYRQSPLHPPVISVERYHSALLQF